MPPTTRFRGRSDTTKKTPRRLAGTTQQPVLGRARLGRKTKDLVKRLDTDDIAVIDHADLDRIAAEDLIKSGIAAVINASPSITGRYPNAGPLMLLEAGMVLVDVPDIDIFGLLEDGDAIEIINGEIRRDGELVAAANRRYQPEVEAAMAHERSRIDEAIANFASNTIAHMQEEGELLSGELQFPDIRTSFRDRHVLIAVRGPAHRSDLQALLGYIAEVKPLLVAVDGAADAFIEFGLKPDMILGDMDSASDAALASGAELVVHAYKNGKAPGRERLEELGLDHLVMPAGGTSQDVAMLLAYEKGAELIVSVGAHFNLEEFLDKNRAGMSSTFLTRLRIGDILVDAKGVGRLYRTPTSLRHLGLVAAAFVVLLVIVLLSSPALVNLLDLLWLKFRVLLDL